MKTSTFKTSAFVTLGLLGAALMAQSAPSGNPDQFSVRGLVPPGSYASHEAKPMTIAVFVSGKGIGRSTGMETKRVEKGLPESGSSVPSAAAVKGLSPKLH